MWIRPTLPSSSCRNAPYGVMRWTAPSTTAPTSRSAIGTPFRKMRRDRTIPPPPEAVNSEVEASSRLRDRRMKFIFGPAGLRRRSIVSTDTRSQSSTSAGGESRMQSEVAERQSTRVAARAVDAVKVYGRGDAAVRALDGISAEFPAGQFTAIMGPSGSGKSTLLHCLAGLDSLTSGQVFIGDVDLTALDEKRLTLLRREKIGFVFQAYNLVPTLSAEENITLPMDIAGRKPDQGWLDNVIDTVDLRNRLSHRPSE